ncbi:MAG: ABC transporter ATP-binding protein [Candidatus Bathyarchaeia archaeon]|jgi:peptide/nickel transport system ATP-binding protein
MSTEEILTVKSLKKYFKTSRGMVKAVDDVSFSVKKNETFGLVGESGSGKSTVGHVIMGIYNPTAGDITFLGKDISMGVGKRPKELKKQLQIVFQNPASSLNPRRTVKQILELPLRVHRLAEDGDYDNKVQEMMDLIELPREFAERYPGELGGGEKQAVAIGRALATNPSFVVLDEPTSALDVSIQAKIINMLIRFQKEFNLSYLFITHNLSLMRNVAQRVGIMYLGKIGELTDTSEFFSNPLHPYTKMLISAVPVITPEEEALKPEKVTSTGEITGALHIPPGCSFHPRCPFAMDVCSKTIPPLVEYATGHHVACHLYPSSANA